jgi:hypothetical protein
MLHDIRPVEELSLSSGVQRVLIGFVYGFAIF